MWAWARAARPSAANFPTTIPSPSSGGAAGGVLLGEGLHYANSKQNDQSYQTGYDKGRSDAVKQQYWLYVSMQQAKAGDEGRVRLYEVHLPEQDIDGVIFKPTTQFLRIEEYGAHNTEPAKPKPRKENKHEKTNRSNPHRPAAGVLRPRAVDRL